MRWGGQGGCKLEAEVRRKRSGDRPFREGANCILLKEGTQLPGLMVTLVLRNYGRAQPACSSCQAPGWCFSRMSVLSTGSHPAPMVACTPCQSERRSLQVCLGVLAPALPVVAILAPLRRSNEALVLGFPFNSDLNALWIEARRYGHLSPSRRSPRVGTL